MTFSPTLAVAADQVMGTRYAVVLGVHHRSWRPNPCLGSCERESTLESIADQGPEGRGSRSTRRRLASCRPKTVFEWTRLAAENTVGKSAEEAEQTWSSLRQPCVIGVRLVWTPLIVST